MNSFAGIFSRDAALVDTDRLETLVDASALKPYERESIWSETGIAFGIRERVTLKEDLEHQQPSTASWDKSVIVFDGRIDNRAELLTFFPKTLHITEKSPDCLIVLAAYHVWRQACLEKIQGGFAFAIWDSADKTLFCARDHLGEKPFYYRFDGKTFVFASELNQLVQDPDYYQEPEEHMIGCWLLDHNQDTEHTLYRNILRLPPAHFLQVTQDHFVKQRYWTLTPQDFLNYDTDDAYADHFRSIFEQAVRTRMRAVGPLGTFLSGGLDSSSVSCMANRITKETPDDSSLQSFSLIFEKDPTADESDAIRTIADHCGLNTHFLDPEQFPEQFNLSYVPPYPKGPYYTPNLMMMNVIMEEAGKIGIRTMLTGYGGDEILTTLDYLADLNTVRKWPLLISEINAISHLFNIPITKLFFRYGILSRLPKRLRTIFRLFHPHQFPDWMEMDFILRSGLREHMATPNNDRMFPDNGRQAIYERLFTNGDIALFFEEDNRYTRPYGMETRSPLYDLNVIEFIMKLPNSQKFWQGWSKRIMRNTMKGILPDTILDRKEKNGDFTALIDRQLKQGQRKEIEGLLVSSKLAKSGIVDQEKLLNLWLSYYHGPEGTDSWKRWDLLSIVHMEKWYRTL